MAKYGSQGQNKEDIKDLVRQGGLVSFGVTLSSSWCFLSSGFGQKDGKA